MSFQDAATTTRYSERVFLDDPLRLPKFLRPTFGGPRLAEITPEAIEDYVEGRLSSGRRVHTKFGVRLRGKLKPSTVHKEFRVFRHLLNVAVKQTRPALNPCTGVEFPVRLRGSTRKPHYMTASEQAQIELCAPDYLRNAIVILVEIGLRPHEELAPMQNRQVDLRINTCTFRTRKATTASRTCR